MDQYLKAQPAMAAGKGCWLPPFTGGSLGAESMVQITYPLFEFPKTGKRELRAAPLKLQSPPAKDGEQQHSEMSWDKVVPGTMLRIKVNPEPSAVSIC